LIAITDKEKIIIETIISEYAPDFDVLVFGSRYSHTQKNHSDIDLAFIGQIKMDFKTRVRLENAFEESDLPYFVDVVDYLSVSGDFRKIIDNGNEYLFKNRTPNNP